MGLHLDADFSWHSHVEAITSKATKRLYFLKQLKRAGVPHAQLLHLYLAVIRPVLEYAAPVWRHSLNKSQKNRIEAIQKRAIRIIFSCTCDMPYTSALFVAGLEDLESCRDLLSHIFSNLFYYRHLVYIVYFRHLAILNYCLASPSKYPRISNRTKKYQSFISYALAHYQ